MSDSPVRADFPILRRLVNGQTLTYLDNAATSQKPQQVIDGISEYYALHNANVHRGVHALADEATERFEGAREQVRGFINAATISEVLFTRGTTESINLVANGLRHRLAPGDEILITYLEHHSNIVPWQMLASATGATLVACAVTPNGELDLADFHAHLNQRTKVVAFGHVSNALGTVNPVRELVQMARDAGALSVIDGAQAAAHLTIDVAALDCDFYAFSGHKMFGPTGIGVLYGKEQLLEEMPPWQGGGEMIERVTIEETSYNRLPYKFEAGTPNIAGAIGLAAAIEYLGGLDRAALLCREHELVSRTIAQLNEINQVQLIGKPQERLSVVSFLVTGAHPNDIGTLLDQQGVAVRTGHHCAMPLMDYLGIPGTIRASFSIYNDEDDVERLISGVRKALSFL